MTAGADQARDAEPKTRIFISYSRKDMAFADRLVAALAARGFEPLIDRHEIENFEDWWKRIKSSARTRSRASSAPMPSNPRSVGRKWTLRYRTTSAWHRFYGVRSTTRLSPINCGVLTRSIFVCGVSTGSISMLLRGLSATRTNWLGQSQARRPRTVLRCVSPHRLAKPGKAMGGERRASNGLYYRIEGTGEPLLPLHGLMVAGAMFDPLVRYLRNEYRMLIPDLRGHGGSGDLAGPYDVPALAADLDCVVAEAGFQHPIVLGYSHGGAVAQQFVHMWPQHVSRLVLTCTYACNAMTRRERIEADILVALLGILGPGTIAKLMLRASHTGLSPDQREWLQALMAVNSRAAMREAAKGLVTFDSRPWLNHVKIPTLVIAGARDDAVPRHHYDTLVNGIHGAVGHLVEGAGHLLAWTHTRELADIMRSHAPRSV